jgi:hypothetical protein
MNDRDRSTMRCNAFISRGFAQRPVMLERDGPLPHPAGDSGAVTRHTFPTESRMNKEDRGYGPGLLLARRYQFCLMLP